MAACLRLRDVPHYRRMGLVRAEAGQSAHLFGPDGPGGFSAPRGAALAALEPEKQQIASLRKLEQDLSAP